VTANTPAPIAPAIASNMAPRRPAGPPAGPQLSNAAAPSLPAGALPFGLDGFCPVQLMEKGVWSPGNRQWGAIHRGRTYLFAGPDEQHRFLGDPDRYAPVSSGEDIVVALEQGRSMPGNRLHGVFYGGRVFLFADEGSLDRFSKNPKFYADRALQALQTSTPSGSQVR
jgi:YHS domain-containing protein